MYSVIKHKHQINFIVKFASFSEHSTWTTDVLWPLLHFDTERGSESPPSDTVHGVGHTEGMGVATGQLHT